jgi:uncharacterized protein
MTHDDIFDSAPPEFPSTARLFPLAHLVMFPHVLQPLRIFEPRYIEMVEDALAGDGLIAMGLILPGYELEYEGRPPVFDVGCVGQILTHDKMPGGIYNILLQGVRRMKIVSELPPDRPFRLVQAEPLDDQYLLATAADRAARRQRLVDSFKGVMPGSPSVHLGLDHLLGSDLSLGELTDIVAYTIDLDLDLKQRLLAEADVDARAEHLIRALSPDGDVIKRRFPPDFSSN